MLRDGSTAELIAVESAISLDRDRRTVERTVGENIETRRAGTNDA